VEPGEGLDFVANLGVAGKVGGFDPALADAVGGFLLRAKVLGLVTRVHQTSRFPGDLSPELGAVHSWRR
jgi:hypothetical protein